MHPFCGVGTFRDLMLFPYLVHCHNHPEGNDMTSRFKAKLTVCLIAGFAFAPRLAITGFRICRTF